MEFKDRRSLKPGRYSIQPTDGSAPFIADLTRADYPIDEGTPLNAATFNKMMECLTARNLLDNSDFRNPVNQRGGDAYNGAPMYTIDRWRKASKIVTYVEKGYIYLQCASDAETRNGFTQDLAPEKTPVAGTPVTVAYKSYNGGIAVESATMPSDDPVYLFGRGDSSGVMLYGGDSPKISIMVPPGQFMRVEWIALYDGEFSLETIPTFRHRNYSEELMECMRYYQICSTGNVSPMDLRPTMRANPEITQLDNGGYAYSADL